MLFVAQLFTLFFNKCAGRASDDIEEEDDDDVRVHTENPVFADDDMDDMDMFRDDGGAPGSPPVDIIIDGGRGEDAGGKRKGKKETRAEGPEGATPKIRQHET